MNYALLGDGTIVDIGSYAVVENGIVTNLAWIRPENAAEFPSAVPVGDRPVTIGDAYADGVFTRGGEPVLSIAEELDAAGAAIAELDTALLDAEYENLIGGIEA